MAFLKEDKALLWKIWKDWVLKRKTGPFWRVWHQRLSIANEISIWGKIGLFWEEIRLFWGKMGRFREKAGRLWVSTYTIWGNWGKERLFWEKIGLFWEKIEPFWVWILASAPVNSKWDTIWGKIGLFWERIGLFERRWGSSGYGPWHQRLSTANEIPSGER